MQPLPAPEQAEEFCPIPFLQLQLNPMGSVSACCFSGEVPVGTVPSQGIQEIWNGEKMQAWRKEFLEGNIRTCRAPIDTFQCHKNYRHLIPNVELKEIQSHGPRRLDLRFNGKCNLQCQMCDVWKQPNGIYDSSDFWVVGPTEIFPYLLEVDMLGGEPFIQADTFRFIDAVSAVNPRCTWGFITNGNYVLNAKLISYLDKLILRHIHISLDAMSAETYAKIRVGGRWEKTLQTVKDYAAYRARRSEEGRGFALFASFCVQRDNWRELPSFLLLCEELGLTPIIQNVITDDTGHRAHLAIANLRTEAKAEILDFLKERVSPQNQDYIRPILNLLGQSGA
jgi:cyclic pyranopterin phosphate synthase